MSDGIGFSHWIRLLTLAGKVINFISHQELNGLWCSCWQNAKTDQTYQLGTMRQFFSFVSGEFYSKDEQWKFTAKFKGGILIGAYSRKGNAPCGSQENGQDR